jgi:hypothetical protein
VTFLVTATFACEENEKKHLWREYTLFSIIDKEQRQANQVSADIDEHALRNASSFSYAIISSLTK